MCCKLVMQLLAKNMSLTLHKAYSCGEFVSKAYKFSQSNTYLKHWTRVSHASLMRLGKTPRPPLSHFSFPIKTTPHPFSKYHVNTNKIKPLPLSSLFLSPKVYSFPFFDLLVKKSWLFELFVSWEHGSSCCQSSGLPEKSLTITAPTHEVPTEPKH